MIEQGILPFFHCWHILATNCLDIPLSIDTSACDCSTRDDIRRATHRRRSFGTDCSGCPRNGPPVGNYVRLGIMKLKVLKPMHIDEIFK
jgi:hypothetical protein